MTSTGIIYSIELHDELPMHIYYFDYFVLTESLAHAMSPFHETIQFSIQFSSVCYIRARFHADKPSIPGDNLMNSSYISRGHVVNISCNITSHYNHYIFGKAYST